MTGMMIRLVELKKTGLIWWLTGWLTIGLPAILTGVEPTPRLSMQGTIVEVRIEGLQLIEKGLLLSTIQSRRNVPLSPVSVADDIKAIYQLGFFTDVTAEVETLDDGQVVLIFRVVEKPRITRIEITGAELITLSTLTELLKVYRNNMVNISKIEADIKTLLNEYRKKGYIQTEIDYRLHPQDDGSVALIYEVNEAPKVFLTDITVTGTRVYPPLDIERLMASSEIDCFSWANDSGVFQEDKVNQDLQLLTQHYLQNGYIKVRIDKPDVTLIKNPDQTKVRIDLHITEGEQYFTGKIDIVTDDTHPLLFDKETVIADMALKSGDVFNPYKQNTDRFKINEIYESQGYAFSRIRVGNRIHDDTRTVDITYTVTRGEKAYLGRVEIMGNYETMDHVIRRELEVHDNELYDGVKLRESYTKINRLGFFEQAGGVRFDRVADNEDNTIDYNIILNEAQTGTFNASITYSGYSGLALILSLSKKNFMGTGRTVTLSTEQKDEGQSRYDISLVSPYWLDTRFTNTLRLFSVFEDEELYDTRSYGFNFGLSYPIWKDWSAFSNFAWRNEDYSTMSSLGSESLAGATQNSYRSLRLGTEYNTVDHPLFPSDGLEASLSAEQFGGYPLGGSIEYRAYHFNTRYFKTLNEAGTLVFGAKFNWSVLEKSNPDKDIPYHGRYTIGGITTVRGFNWGEIKGPSSYGELRQTVNDFVKQRFPYQGDYGSDCRADPVCAALPAEKPADRRYFEQHQGGISRRILNLQMYYPLTREGTRIRGLVFYDAGNVWAEDRMYEIAGLEKDDWYYRSSWGFGVNIITPMGVLRFEYGIKLDRLPGESPSRFDFHISGLF
jgi:outer membrane protein insertion porin family